MDSATLPSIPLPAEYVVPVALGLAAVGIVLLGLTFLILFHGKSDGKLSGMRLGAAAVTFAGGLFLPTLVAAAVLLSPPAESTFAAGARPAKQANVARETAKAPAANETPRPGPTTAATKAPSATSASSAAATPTAAPAQSQPDAAKAKAAVAIKSDPASVARGKTIVLEQNCLACHRINGQGGAVGPDLSDIGHRRDADWLMRHFNDPQAVSPGTLMPKFKLSDADFAALTAYMLTLLGGQQ